MSAPVVFLHVLGAAIWAGGLIFVGLVAAAARRTVAERDQPEFFRVLGRGFLGLAGLAAALLAVSGTILVDDLFGGWGELGESGSGRLVLWKTGLFAAVIALALVHSLVLGPRIRQLREAQLDGAAAPEQAAALRRARRLSHASQGLMLAGTIAILALAADLVT